MIYNPVEPPGRINPLGTILSLLTEEPQTMANMRIVLAYLKVVGIIPETHVEFIKVIQVLQETCGDSFNLNPVLDFIKERNTIYGEE